MNEEFTVHTPPLLIYIIIPVYNCEKYLSEAIESVLTQPYKDIQIVLVDDGSTDSSPSICDDWATENDRIHVIHKPNGGVSSARNAGMEYVFNELSADDNSYIAFLDADDAWHSCINEINFLRYATQKYDMICYQTNVCNGNLSRHRQTETLSGGDHDGGNKSLWIHRGHFASILYRVNFLKKHCLRFYPISASEDKIFLMQSLYLAHKIYQENVALYKYRHNTASASHSRPTGIEYYEPIIDAYLKSDFDMAKWANEERGKLIAGNTLARVYIMDMIDEHYQSGGSKQQIMDYLKSRPDLLNILLTDNGAPDQNERMEKILNYSHFDIAKKRVRGLIQTMLRSVYYFKPIKHLADMRRYPVKLI